MDYKKQFLPFEHVSQFINFPFLPQITQTLSIEFLF